MRGVAVSFDHDVRTCGHVVGKVLSRHQPSGKRGLDGVAVQALEHEALEALFVVLFFFFYSIARRFEKRSTLVTEKLRRTCGHGVLCAREGLEVRT